MRETLTQDAARNGSRKIAWEGVVEHAAAPGMRLDRYVSETLSLLSRSQVKARNLAARINGKTAKLSRAVKAGDALELFWDAAPLTELAPEHIPLEIIYEDRRVIVINKKQGMVVHPGAGNFSGTLANALLARRQESGGTGRPENETSGNIRTGIVHRLDKDTSGVIIAAWDEAAREFLSRQFAARETRKTYAALVRGAPPEKRGKIDTFLARDPKNRKRFAVTPEGKRAVTFYRAIRFWSGYTLLLLRPETGRTHQIRVHLKHLGCPVLGDSIYGSGDSRFPGAGLMLHALRLSITLPGEKDPATFSAPLPPGFKETVRALGEPLV